MRIHFPFYLYASFFLSHRLHICCRWLHALIPYLTSVARLFACDLTPRPELSPTQFVRSFKAQTLGAEKTLHCF